MAIPLSSVSSHCTSELFYSPTELRMCIFTAETVVVGFEARRPIRDGTSVQNYGCHFFLERRVRLSSEGC